MIDIKTGQGQMCVFVLKSGRKKYVIVQAKGISLVNLSGRLMIGFRYLKLVINFRAFLSSVREYFY